MVVSAILFIDGFKKYFSIFKRALKILLQIEVELQLLLGLLLGAADGPAATSVRQHLLDRSVDQRMHLPDHGLSCLDTRLWQRLLLNMSFFNHLPDFIWETDIIHFIVIILDSSSLLDQLSDWSKLVSKRGVLSAIEAKLP